MKSITTHTTVMSGARAAVLGLAMISLVNCSSSDDAAAPTPGGSAGLSGPMVFVNNTSDKTLTSVALKGDTGNTVINTIDATEFENVALGDMQFSQENWVFVSLGAANKVAAIDPLTGATPIHRANLVTGTRPVHLYRDSTDGEIIWSMNDGDNATGTTTLGDDLINCNNPLRVGGPVEGGSVTILHNAHLGPGANPPTVEGTVCILADGHKVSAFSLGTGVPKRVFTSSTTAGEIAVIDNDLANVATYRKLIGRIDLCVTAKEITQPVPAVCNNESATPLTTPFTVNNSNPHGIRFSKLTSKVYSIQQNYRTIVEINPATLAITNAFDLSLTPYTGYGISPNGRFLMLRGQTTPPTPQTVPPTPQTIRLGVIDLSATNPVIVDLSIPELEGTSTGTFAAGGSSFKFSPDGNRFYLVVGNATVAKKDRLFAFDASTLTTATPPTLTLLKEIVLAATGRHSFDVLAQGAREATFLVVSNSTDNSISIFNATDNLLKQTVTVGADPRSVLVFYPGAAAAGNQATSSVTGGAKANPSVLPERLDDHGMPE